MQQSFVLCIKKVVKKQAQIKCCKKAAKKCDKKAIPMADLVPISRKTKQKNLLKNIPKSVLLLS